MNRGEVANAIRNGLNRFDEWNDVTGVIEKNTGYYWEMQGVIEQVVRETIQLTLGLNPDPTSTKGEDNQPNQER